jgi:ABC-2 type transport system permease protein
MNWRRVRVIARREFWTTVRRREFLLITFGLPLLYFVIAVGIGAATMSAARSTERQEERKALVIGWRDLSGLLDPATLVDGDDVKGKLYATTAAGQEAVRDRKARAFVEVPANYAKTGAITVYLSPSRGSVFSQQNSRDSSLIPTIRRALLQNRLPAALVERVVEPPDITRLSFDPRSGIFAETNPLEALSRFAIPYVFSLLLMVAVLFSSSYLLHGIVEEKENRVMEVLLSAASHEDLLIGKLIGLGGAGIAQFGLWVATGSIGGVVALQFMRQLAPFVFSPGVALVGMLMFLLGFALYAALMAGIGSFGTSWRESQQISGVLVLFLVIPLMLLPLFLETPDGVLPRVLSLFPMTAPIALMLRVAAGGAGLWEIALTIAILAISVVLVVRLSSKLFHLSLLMYGQRPSFGEILHWLRAA